MSDSVERNLLSREELYHGKIVDVVVDQIEIEGARYVREVIRHPGGVVVLGELPDGRIPFVRQHRYPMDKVFLELPAGKLDPGEEPQVAAAREMEEETGWRPCQLQQVHNFYSSPGFCDEMLYLYYAAELIKGQSNLEIDEHLEVEYYMLDEALQKAQEGDIPDAKSLVALYWLRSRRNEVESTAR